MAQLTSADAHLKIHRGVAMLFVGVLPLVLLVDLVASGGSSVSRAATYLVPAAWAVGVMRSKKPNGVTLVVSSAVFFASLSVVESLLGTSLSAFDFTTTFGLVLILGILTGIVNRSNRMVWNVAFGFGIATWSILVGLLEGHPVDAYLIRSVVALGGIVLAGALMARLIDDLSNSIDGYTRASRLQAAVARCSEALLVQTEENAIEAAITALLGATDSDYGYVDVVVPASRPGDAPGFEIIADCSRSREAVPGDWMIGSYAELPTTFEGLSKGRAIFITTSELSGEERRRYEEDRIVSEVCVPIEVSGEWRGSIGFVDYHQERTWSTDEVEALWRAAHMIGSYWRRDDDRRALESLLRSKDELVASVSHELRTPLTAIVGLSDELSSGTRAFDAGETAELVSVIAVQSRELSQLVEDLLVAARLDQGSVSIKPGWVDLLHEARLVTKAVLEAHPSNQEISISDGAALAWGDPLRCRQIIRNLISNAIRYGGHRVAVSAVGSDEAVRIIVADDGRGIPEEDRDRIFDRYYRSHISPTMPGSVGIGLSVAKELAQMMGGQLEYVGGNAMAAFALTLPRREGAVAEVVAMRPQPVS